MILSPNPYVAWYWRPFTRSQELLIASNVLYLVNLFAVAISATMCWRHHRELLPLLMMLFAAIATLPSERWWYHFLTLFFWIPFHWACAGFAIMDFRGWNLLGLPPSPSRSSA